MVSGDGGLLRAGPRASFVLSIPVWIRAFSLLLQRGRFLPTSVVCGKYQPSVATRWFVNMWLANLSDVYTIIDQI